MWWLSTILVLTHGLGLLSAQPWGRNFMDSQWKQADVERPNFMNALWRQPIGAFRLPLWQKSSPITSSPGLEGLEAWNPSFMPSYSSNTRTYYSSSRGISRGSSIGIPSSFLNPPRSSMFIPPYSLISRTYYSATPSISREPSPIGRPGSLMNPPRSSSSYGEYNAPQKPIDKYTLNLFGSPPFNFF
uniref:Uncharacterized protein n=1 Tax=Cacopsylla melanoneura TaxID=428564 RepID=A0A8D8ZNQ9_9HEMI